MPDEKTIWDRKYGGESPALLDPDPLLVSAHNEYMAGREPGTALDVAGGAGRHAIWLARRGWRSVILDISSAGLELAAKNVARALGPDSRESLVQCRLTDLNQVNDLGADRYDVLMVFYYLHRPLFPALIKALKPDGLLLYKTYTTDQRRLGGGPDDPNFLLEPNELLDAFSTLRILHYHESIHERGVAELVGRKSARQS